MTEVVVSSCGEGFKQEIWAGQHTLVADEPSSVGGADSGPAPYELLLASLGACTSMTLVLYARRKKWPLEHVEIRLRHNRRELDDCEHCDREDRFLDQIEKSIVVSGPLTDDQVERLGEIAEKCPVNRTLHRSINTTLEIRRAD
jgi:putative redox protein